MHLPEPVVSGQGGVDPEQQALLAEGSGWRCWWCWTRSRPPSAAGVRAARHVRGALEEIAPIVGRSPAAAKMLASRARRRVQGAAPLPDADLARQREVVDAFLAAAREGNFAALVAVLDPDVVVRADSAPAGISVVRGAAAVAEQALAGGFSRLARMARPALVNGAAGVVFAAGGRPFAVGLHG